MKNDTTNMLMGTGWDIVECLSEKYGEEYGSYRTIIWDTKFNGGDFYYYMWDYFYDVSGEPPPNSVIVSNN